MRGALVPEKRFQTDEKRELKCTLDMNIYSISVSKLLKI